MKKILSIAIAAILAAALAWAVWRLCAPGKVTFRQEPAECGGYGRGARRLGGAGLQQGPQPSLRVHALCHVPAASAGEPPGGENRGGGKELRALASAPEPALPAAYSVDTF
jgi:hypothetical protein